MNLRSDKIGSVIQRVLGVELQQLELPFLTTIVKVEVTDDLKYAKVWISVLPSGVENEKQILGILKENIYDLQGSILKELAMKIVPRISFKVDVSQEYASKINELIRKTHEED